MSDPKDLREKFQLAPQPESVSKIARLVKGRANASMDEIAKIIESEDHTVSKRLISMAYPRPNSRIGATVQMATSRLGVNQVIVVMVGDLLTKAVVETFETMLSMTLETDTACAISLADHGYLTASVKFTGQCNGQVTLAFSPHFSMVLAAQLLETGPDDELSAEAINDVIGEIVNIVTGNLQSRLSDAGMPSEVAIPEVRFQRSLSREGVSDQFFFCTGIHTMIVLLTIDPSASKAASALKSPSTSGSSWRANGI
jgi:CheY-specific phosphatase CheX